MSLTERTAYLRGLADGMALRAEDSNEHKLLLAMVETMEDIAAHVEANEESIAALADELEELDDAVTELEELLEQDDEDDDEDDEDEDGETVEYELTCPECGGPVILDEETIAGGETVCPNCQQRLEVDLGYEEEPDSAES